MNDLQSSYDRVAEDFCETATMKTNLITAGFELFEVIERDPYPEIEFQSRRAYIFARMA